MPVGTIVSVDTTEQRGREWSDLTIEDPAFYFYGREVTGQSWLIESDDIGRAIRELLDMAAGRGQPEPDSGRTPEKYAQYQTTGKYNTRR